MQEELYFVQQGRARFELDGEQVDAPAGTFVFAAPDVKRTAFAEEPGTTLIAIGGVPGKPYQAHGGELWMPLHHLYESGAYAEAADRGRDLIEAHPEYAGPLYNLACCESLAGGPTTRSSIFGSRSTATSRSARWPQRTPTSIRSATRPRSRSWFRAEWRSRPAVSGRAQLAGWSSFVSLLPLVVPACVFLPAVVEHEQGRAFEFVPRHLLTR